MQKYQSTITATNGSVIRNVPVTVLKEDGGLAEIFMDREGQVQAPNPLVTDSRGVFYFYAKNGRYSLRTAADGVQITDADTVLLFDPDETASDGPIADAVRRAEDAAERAETALSDSGLQNMVQDAQDAAANAAQAVIDAHQAVASIDAALIEVSEAKEDAQAAAQTASTAASDAQAVKDSLLNYDGTLSATPSFDDVPAHADPVFDAPAQALANRTEIIKNAVLSYPDYAAASAAAATLPDGHEVIAPDESGVHTRWIIQSGALSEVAKIGLDVTNFGARTTNTSAQNDVAFLAAEAAANGAPIYVPKGTFQLTSNQIHGQKNGVYFGPGVLRYDRCYFVRKGGSGGGASTEWYTLFFEYSSQSDVFVEINGVPQSFTWQDTNTVIAPGSTGSDTVNIGAVNGFITLSNTPQQIRSQSMYTSGGAFASPNYTPPAMAGGQAYQNTALGVANLLNVTTGGGNTAVGSRNLTSLTTGGNNVAVGTQVLYRTTIGTNNTAIGSIAMEHNYTGGFNTAVGANAIAALQSGDRNVGVGFQALGDQRTGEHNVAVGNLAMGNNSTAGPVSSCTAIGSMAYRFGRADTVTAVGYCALGEAVNTGERNTALGWKAGGQTTTGSDNLYAGFRAGELVTTGGNNVVLGSQAGSAMTINKRTVLVGALAGQNATVDDMVAVGYKAGQSNTTGIRCTAVGSLALSLASSNDNTAVGYGALQNLTSGVENTSLGLFAGSVLTTGEHNTNLGLRTGSSENTGSNNTNVGWLAGQWLVGQSNNTNVGAASGRLMQNGSNAVAVSNSTCLGNGAAVSGSNQVQLGNSSTTTYAYGAVQDRSDARDKADVRDTVLGLDFIKDLRAVDFKWDMRDDYVVTHEDGSVEVLQKDGSKKRNRYHHGLIAQQVREVMERHGVDFGGFQDHSMNGGCDVLSIGYTELIAPLIKAVQELSAQVESLKAQVEDK